MCILRFHARAGYLQHYETLLKEIHAHPATDPVPPDQYEVERVALSDRNLNVPCESGIRYPSMLSGRGGIYAGGDNGRSRGGSGRGGIHGGSSRGGARMSPQRRREPDFAVRAA